MNLTHINTHTQNTHSITNSNINNNKHLLSERIKCVLRLCHVLGSTGPGPATDIKATPTSASLAVSWTAPTGQEITGYQVELKDVANARKSVAGTSTTFDDLLPGKSYTVVVIPAIGNTLGDPADGTFFTSKCMCCFRSALFV